MLNCDLHVHTIKSRCGYATALEMINRAADLNLDAIAITDHGIFSGGYISHALFRLPDVYRGVHIFKGVEVTVHDDPGKIGLPQKYLSKFHIILAGFHHKFDAENTPSNNTRYLIQYLHAHPYIDVISHPAIAKFPLDFDTLVPEAVKMGVAFEINNKNLKYNNTDIEYLKKMIDRNLDYGGKFVLNSDAHTVFELGEDEAIFSLLESYRSIPEETIINRTLESTIEFIENRKHLKT